MHHIVPATTTQRTSVDVDFLITKKRRRIFFRSNGAALSSNLESFVAAAILPCMRAGGGSLIAEGAMSPRLLSVTPTIQDIYCSWDSSLHRVELQGTIPKENARSTSHRVGTFFSGGVDSSYTFLKQLDEITDLIFVHGLDIRLDNSSLRARTSRNIREIAENYGKCLIEIETNIRELLDPYAAWGRLAHGAALAAIGHLLSPYLAQIYIPASHTYAELFPWGSHPVLDRLWSSESLEYVHDGCEATRVRKVSLIAQHEIILQRMRVCWENPEGSYNCGRCEKCLRTMINLHVNGALHRCTTFDTRLEIDRVAKIEATDESTRSFIQENLEALERTRGNDELRSALRSVLSRPLAPGRSRNRAFSRAANILKRLAGHF